MTTFIVLLRAIGPVTHKVMSMAQWREGVAEAGFVRPETYVATGNMIVDGEGTAAAVTRKMNAVVRQLGLGPGNKAVVRTPRQLQILLKAAPFPGAIAERPGAVAVHFFAGARPDFGWVSDYDGDEVIDVVGNHLVVDYKHRVTGSRLPGVIEKKAGVCTARNWNTLRGLVERCAARKNKD